jgi:DNA-binding transcriptional LysR family regulator
MNINQLELFLAVMNSPNMTRAAEKVFLSPNAVSMQLRSLADELHTELFVRKGKRLIPTPAALCLADRAKEMAGLTNKIRQEFENDVANDTRPFHFATSVTTLIHRLGEPLRQLRKQYPNAEIRVTASATEDTFAGLRSRRFDLGLISLPALEDDLMIIPLFDEELLIVGPSAKKVNGGAIASIRPNELAKVPFLLYPKHSVLRELIDAFFDDIGVSPHVTMEADDTAAIKCLVESGFGYSILPEHALRQRVRSFHSFRVRGRGLSYTLALAMGRTDYPRKLTLSIAGSLQKLIRP